MSKRLPEQSEKTITIKDVARLAEVSVATVSRVLNNHESVDPQLRDRVLQAVERLQYRPNRLARNLRTNSTKVIALVIPDIQNPFFVAVSRGVEEIAFREGYTLLVCNTDDDVQREAHYFRVLCEESIAGIILSSADERLSHRTVRPALDGGVGVVALDRRIEGITIDSVLSDNFGGSRTAISHLIEQGHRRIALIGASDLYAPSRERRQGYEQALLDHNLPVDRELIKVTDFRAVSAGAATEAVLDLAEPPTALFVGSGVSAIGALQVVQNRGLRIPDDVAVVVFDDLDWMESYNPPLTAVAQDTRQLGNTVAMLLLRRIRGDTEPVQERRMPTQLKIRRSSLSR